MGDTNSIINVTFLGENYSFPGELAQYVTYCNGFEKISDRLMNKLLVTMKKKPMAEGDNSYTDMHEKFEVDLQNEGKKFITMLSKIGVYDVTESDVIYENKGYKQYIQVRDKMQEGTRKIMLSYLNSWMEQQDSIYSSAASNIRGSGYGLISNSFLAHATFSAMEYSTLKRQAKEADRQYQQAIGELNRSTLSREEQQYIHFYATEIYPEIAEAFNTFVTELMSIYLLKLQEKGIFDSDKLSDYSLNKSAEILKNIKLVDDKKAVLVEAYKTCPFNPDIYADVMTYGLFDVDTMKGAKEFHQETLLVEMIEKKIVNNLKNHGRVKNYIEVLEYYQGKSETDILRKFYENTISKIKNDYYKIFLVCDDPTRLKTWINNHINKDRDKIASTPVESVIDIVNSWIKETVDDEQYEKLSDMRLININDIKYIDSTKNTLAELQAEYADKMIVLILNYIKELREKKVAYEKAYDKYNTGLKKQIDAIAAKNDELKQQGLFAFSKKKELKEELDRLNNEYKEYRRTEPVHLKNMYFNM